jgi:hypothetical protein
MSQDHEKRNRRAEEFVKFRIPSREKEAVQMHLIRAKISLQAFGQAAFREHLKRLKNGGEPT